MAGLDEPSPAPFLAQRRDKAHVLNLDDAFALGQRLQKRLIDAARSMP